MKKTAISFILTMLISQFSNAQNNPNNYNKDWEKVSAFEKEALPKSALEEVERIYTKAKKNSNSPQLIKTLLYKSKFALTLSENAQLKVINDFKTEITENIFPTKNIIESILADVYWQYFQQNRWKFYNRTNTEEKVDTVDFRTWDLQTIFEEIQLHYKNSLTNSLELQQTPLKQFNNILNQQKDSQLYRPTLYDFLAHRAIDFYKVDEQNITKPVYKFEIDNPSYLGDNNTFIKTIIDSKDSSSQHLLALKLYKNLTLFHLKDNNPDALIKLTLERLSFVKGYAVFNDKDPVYLNTLHDLKETFEDHEISTEISFNIATLLNQQANDYDPNTNETNRFKRIESLEVCNGAIKVFPSSNGAKKCAELKSQILSKNIALTAEKFIPINSPSRLLVNYKNIDNLYLSAYKTTRKQQEKFYKIQNDSTRIEFIEKLNVEKEWNTSIRDEKDHQQHTTEIQFPKLSQGNYLIVSTTDTKELNKEETLAYTFIQVTDLALIEENKNGLYKYQVVNRNTGKPIENAQVNLKNYNTGKYNKPINKNFTTDGNGQFIYKSTTRHNNVVATVNYKEDKATFGEFYLYQYRNRNEVNVDNTFHIKPFLFTDRSIYRPGQTVNFKAIVIKKQGEKSEVFTHQFIEIILKDPNGQEVKKLELKLNEFGSVSGEFILPSSGLTGEYSINIDEGSMNDSKFYTNVDYDFYSYNNTYISVEEYKRPKFETFFKPITETYKLNDSITVEGTATAFAGSTISDGKVFYRVVRTANFPRWYGWYSKRPSYNSEQMEITHGETVTDASGTYNITFKSIPDLKVSKESQPIFNYKVIADVTDINGETRSTETTVRIGYHALTASVNLDSKINKNSKENTLTINTENLNREFVPTQGTVKIYKLQAPENPLRERPWNAPDYQDFTQDEFQKLYPHDPYTDDENNSSTWKKGKLVFVENFDTGVLKEIKFNPKKWNSGKYIAIVECKDKFDQEVKDQQQFDLFSLKDTQVSDNKLFFINTNKTSYSPNDEVLVTIGSSSRNLTATIDIEKENKIIKTHFIHLNDEIKTIKIPVTEDDFGGFSIKYHFVNYNSFENGAINVVVPHKVDNLHIETMTFRDKLQPGSEQTWGFKIKGDKNDTAVAELLASMYDASLDEFKSHDWSFNPIEGKRNYYSYNNSAANNSFGNNRFIVRNLHRNYYNRNYDSQGYDALNWFGFTMNNRRMMFRSKGLLQSESITVMESTESDEVSFSSNDRLDEVVITGLGGKVAGVNIEDSPTDDKIDTELSKILVRKNLQETAFFFPHLRTDKDGNVSFDFTVPEALTRWKLQLLAHTKELKSATKTLTTITQKELMVLPNPPRFLRDGDLITFSSKISNLTDETLNGFAQLQLIDAITGKEVNDLLGNTDKNKNFTVDAKGNTNVSWALKIPINKIQAIQYKIVAKAGDFSDGEQNALPVLSNRMLVTETLPMWIKSNETKTFTLDKLKNNTSTTLSNHKLTLEVTSNPAWYAVQALPYLMEYPYECSEQTFSRFYANVLATHIANSNPRIQEVFNQWKSSDALLSNLEKNQELKSMIIEETPWLRDAQSETEQKKRIALLFDLNKMKNQSENAIKKLEQMQFSNGGFPWFKGSKYPNRYITQHIASGFGHLKKLNVVLDGSQESIVKKAVKFLDEDILDDYNKLLERAEEIRKKAKTNKKGLKDEKEYLEKQHLSYFQLQYLYMRSFYPEIKLNKKTQVAADYYTNQSATYWKSFNLYAKGLIALIQYRTADKTISTAILKSLKENSITNEELGMYWKSNTPSWYWYQAPVETQALMIEAFSEIENDIVTIDNLKIWLLKNKQTNRWETTKSTTEAVYALLLQGSDWLEVTDFIDVRIGNETIDPLALEETKIEAGTGYFKTSYFKDQIIPEMATVTLTKDTDGIAWGALYWQYFEDLDKITSAETPLKLAKKLFLKTNTDTGEKISEITDKTNLKLGDFVRVRIELKVDREMEFVHMKDMRASGFEPINVLSRYKYQDGLGYYESTKDASTNFFFDRLPKGVYVFEYDLRVNNAGDFSNGITTIQSMYAPEFSSHSEGVRVKID